MSYSAFDTDDDKERFLALQLRNGWGKGAVTLIEPTPTHGSIVTVRQMVERTMNKPGYQEAIKRDVLSMLTRLGKKAGK